jgi:hypothetical protein
MANGKSQMAKRNFLVAFLPFAICLLPFAILFAVLFSA